jgi:hypothetical protein
MPGGGAYRLTVESQSIKLPDATVLTLLTLSQVTLNEVLSFRW